MKKSMLIILALILLAFAIFTIVSTTHAATTSASLSSCTVKLISINKSNFIMVAFFQPQQDGPDGEGISANQENILIVLVKVTSKNETTIINNEGIYLSNQKFKNVRCNYLNFFQNEPKNLTQESFLAKNDLNESFEIKAPYKEFFLGMIFEIPEEQFSSPSSLFIFSQKTNIVIPKLSEINTIKPLALQ